jgi:hypothetical protein
MLPFKRKTPSVNQEISAIYHISFVSQEPKRTVCQLTDARHRDTGRSCHALPCHTRTLKVTHDIRHLTCSMQNGRKSTLFSSHTSAAKRCASLSPGAQDICCKIIRSDKLIVLTRQSIQRIGLCSNNAIILLVA